MPGIEASGTPDEPEDKDFFSESLPRPGDQLFKESDRATSIDCTGYSNPFSDEPRSPVRRWSLYSDGFLMAGDRLVEGLRGTASEDALIYPILALYRHHLELELKGLVRAALNHSELGEGKIKSDRDKLVNTHGLKSLWKMLQMHRPECRDLAVPEQHAAFESLLFEFDDHDPDSQASRYPMDKTNGQTLTRLRYVDLPTVKAGVHKMSNYLHCIYERVEI